MKLAELLARELKEWPEADFEQGRIESMSQAGDLQVSHYSGVRQVWRDDVSDWSGHDYVPCSRFTLPQLATDHATAIVTRADWEAEKARIAGEVDGGWKRHRGGKMPVREGTKVDVKHRDGCIYRGLTVGEGMAANWGHSKHPEDIMQYRLSSAEKRPSPKLERALKQAEEIRIAAHAPDPILIIRNRIRALDTQRAELEATHQRQIGGIDGERVELVRRLASEGLALVGVAVQQAVQWPEGAPSRESAPEWATHIGRDTLGFHWFDHSPEEFDRGCFLKGCLGDAGYRNGRWEKALKAPNSLPLWSCEI